MFIQTEATPNPATLKFYPGEDVLPNGAEDFPDVDSAEHSSLARKFFSIRGVTRVFYGSDFISISKDDSIHWEHIKPAILGTIMEHFQAGLPVMENSQQENSVQEDPDSPDTPIIKQIKELLDTRVRPAVAQDGGDITFYGFERGVVYLHMKGACAGCPSSTITLKMGIENLLRHYIPEVVEVRPVM
ncbi:MAG: NifU family protein [Rhodobacteraceae bacterium]|nr:NifU family protein [Paracoccaceae bacterium]MCY4250950.1 NifU family protein [Paracoccaceae bacterium]MCY4309174.1 NifU family protein [Paracoccaceae bacterium]